MPLEMDDLKRLAPILREETRYAPDAYAFVQSAVSETLEQIRRRGRTRPDQHISARELLNGIRELAIDEYGPMAVTVLREWGISATLDIGYIVFALERHKLLRLSEEDNLEDFRDAFSLKDELRRPFFPSNGERPLPPSIA